MKTHLVCTLLALTLAVPLVAAESASYGPVVGANVAGSGAAYGANQASLVAGTAFTSITVTAADNVGDHTFFSVCIERAGVANLCSRSDGDLQANGFDSVTLTGFGTLPAGTKVTVFVYTVAVGVDGTVGIGTTGTITATFS